MVWTSPSHRRRAIAQAAGRRSARGGGPGRRGPGGGCGVPRPRQQGEAIRAVCAAHAEPAMTRFPAAFALGLLGCCAALPASATTLIVEATGFDDATGQAMIEVYASRAGFLKQASIAEPQPIVAGETVRWQFDDLAPSDYAVRVWHDLNANGEADKRAFGRNETVVFSRGVTDQKPDWDEVTVTLGPEPVTVVIDLAAEDD